MSVLLVVTVAPVIALAAQSVTVPSTKPCVVTSRLWPSRKVPTKATSVWLNVETFSVTSAAMGGRYAKVSSAAEEPVRCTYPRYGSTGVGTGSDTAPCMSVVPVASRVVASQEMTAAAQRSTVAPVIFVPEMASLKFSVTFALAPTGVGTGHDEAVVPVEPALPVDPLVPVEDVDAVEVVEVVELVLVPVLEAELAADVEVVEPSDVEVVEPTPVVDPVNPVVVVLAALAVELLVTRVPRTSSGAW